MENTLGGLFKDFSIGKLNQYSAEIQRCLARLDDRQVWDRGGSHENTVGNLVLHLCGNVQQRTAAIQGEPDVRVRAREFSASGGISTEELSQRLRATVDAATQAIGGLTEEGLRQLVVVGEFHHTVLESIYHMTVHFSLHAGQIFFATKRITGEDLGFYKPPAPQPETPSNQG